MSIFTSPQSKAFTVLLWGDRWWLAERTESIPFANRDEAVGALAGSAQTGLPERLIHRTASRPKAQRRNTITALLNHAAV